MSEYTHDANLVMAFLLDLEGGASYEDIRTAVRRESTIMALDEAKRRFDIAGKRFRRNSAPSISQVELAMEQTGMRLLALSREAVAGADLEPVTWDALSMSLALVNMLICFRRNEEVTARALENDRHLHEAEIRRANDALDHN